MSLSEWFGFRTPSGSDELPEIFPLPISQSSFVKIDIVTVYSKILTDVLERTHGLSDDELALMWDNCVKSNSSDGLITILAKAMAEKQEIFLVFEKAVNVIRMATDAEAKQIRDDYEKKGESSVGIFVSFKAYVRSDMIKLYLGLEYCTIAALHKSMNLSKATQLKMNDLRAGVSLADQADVKTQAQAIASALASGKDVLLDGKDTIENSVPDLTAVKASIEFLLQKLAFYLGMPSAYLSGEQTGGLGTTGEGDQKAIERGLRGYYFSVLKPVFDALFQSETTYKSQDVRQITSSMDVIKTFSLVDDTLVSAENKRKIINGLLDLPEDAEGDPAPKPVALPPAAVPPVKNPINPKGKA